MSGFVELFLLSLSLSLSTSELSLVSLVIRSPLVVGGMILDCLHIRAIWFWEGDLVRMQSRTCLANASQGKLCTIRFVR